MKAVLVAFGASYGGVTHFAVRILAYASLQRALGEWYRATMKRLSLAFVLLATFATSARAQQGLAGPFKFDMDFGPALGVFDETGSQFHLGFHFGVDLTPHLPHHVYIDIPLGFNFGNHETDIMILPGIEADIALPVGVPIYLYPKFGLGVGIFVPSIGDTQAGFGIHMGGGVKYILDGRWNFYFEPFNLDFYPVGVSVADVTITLGHYYLLFGAGVNF